MVYPSSIEGFRRHPRSAHHALLAAVLIVLFAASAAASAALAPYVAALIISIE